MFKYFIQIKIYLFIFSIPHTLLSQNIKIQSIIVLEESIPNECGLKMLVEEKKIEMIVKIKKINKKTFTFFKTTSINQMPNKVDIITDKVSLVKLIGKAGTIGENDISFEGITDTDKTAGFFQRLIVSGGEMIFNDDKFEVSGPINSKVRLEFLICTGEMFHPKNDK